MTPRRVQRGLLLNPFRFGLSFRYIRWVFTSPWNPGDYFRCAELQVSLSAGGTNLCTGGTASGDGDYSGTPASKAFDGNFSNVSSDPWTGNQGASRIVKYAFAANVTADYARIYNGSGASNNLELNQIVKDGYIQTSADDVTWVTRATFAGRSNVNGTVTEHLLT